VSLSNHNNMCMFSIQRGDVFAGIVCCDCGIICVLHEMKLQNNKHRDQNTRRLSLRCICKDGKSVLR
jgi:hypothetical protein